MSGVDSLVEPRTTAASSASAEGWDLEGIPRRFWPRVRELLQIREQRHFSHESVTVASALVSAVALESIARKAGGQGEGLAKAAASFVADWDGDLCPPYRKWPPKKRRFVAEEIVDILSDVIDTVPEGQFSTNLRSLGASMQQKLSAGQLTTR